jgi:pimeloyl-ACP methyl ester carboxylesterase
VVAGGETGLLDRSIAMAGQVFRYQVYVPLEHTAVAEWPVLVDLHGDGSQGSDGIHQTRRGIADAIRSKRSSYPTLVLFPQAQSGTSFSFTEMQDLVSAELEQTRKEFHGDPKRIYLVGFSMGGSGVYRLAHRWPDRFAAIVPIAGAVVPPRSIPAKVVKADQQANPFVSAPDPYAALAERIAWIRSGYFMEKQTKPFPSRTHGECRRHSKRQELRSATQSMAKQITWGRQPRRMLIRNSLDGCLHNIDECRWTSVVRHNARRTAVTECARESRCRSPRLTAFVFTGHLGDHLYGSIAKAPPPRGD